MIGAFTTLEASAASTVDLFASEAHRQAPYNRKIVGFGLVGSTNPSDAAVELRIAGQIVGKYYNTTGGASKVPTVENDIQRLNVLVPAGSIVQAQIVDAGVTNVLAATIIYEPAVVMRRGGFRSRGRF